MTGVLFGSILLLAAACWARLVSTHGDADSPSRPLALLFLAAAPFLLFGAVVFVAFRIAPAGEYRVALEAVEFDLTAGGNITVGGGTDGDEADDLIVRDLPPRYLTFAVEGDHVVATLPAELDHAIENPVHAVVRVDDVRPFANAVSLADTKTAVFIGRDHLVMNVLERKIEGTGYPVVPHRAQELAAGWKIPIGRNLAAETVMYPLRFWARPMGSNDPVTGTDGAPLGTFLSHDGNFLRRTLFVTLTGDGTAVALPDGTTRGYDPRVAEIRAGQPRRFALFRLDYSDPDLGSDSRSAAQERRSFGASVKDGRLTLIFDTPDIIRLSAKSIAPLIEATKERDSFLLATRDPKRNVPVVANQMVLAFPQLGPRVQNELYSAIRVSKSGDCVVRVTSHMGTSCYASGEGFRIGDRAAAILRVTKMATPWGIIFTMLTLGLFSAAWMRRNGHQTPAVIIISAAEILLAVRLLIAFEGALLDPSSASALWESLAIFALLPFTLRLTWELSRRGRGGSPASFAAVEKSVAAAALAEAVAIMALVGVALSRANFGIGSIALLCAAVLTIPLAVGLLAPLTIERATERTWSLQAIFLLALAIALVRLGMLLGLGWKERISIFGADLALTVLYLPAIFLFFAVLWERYRHFAAEATKRITRRQITVAAGVASAGAALTIVIPFIVKDTGSALVHVPAIVLLFALPVLVRFNLTTSLLALPLAGVMLVHTSVALMPYLRGQEKANPARTKEYQNALSNEGDANEYLAKRLGHSTNQLRVLSHVAPSQVAEAGTSKAEGLAMQRRMLDRYGGRGAFGAGYLNVPLATFRDTHLNDNLSAIHILAPFGIVGAAGILALLLGLALLPLRAHLADVPEAQRESPETALDQRMALGILALFTFSLAGIYMFAANLGLVLFTGKNVYLLAAASNSDAVEGGVLLLIALASFGSRDDAAGVEESQ